MSKFLWLPVLFFAELPLFCALLLSSFEDEPRLVLEPVLAVSVSPLAVLLVWSSVLPVVVFSSDPVVFSLVSVVSLPVCLVLTVSPPLPV